MKKNGGQVLLCLQLGTEPFFFSPSAPEEQWAGVSGVFLHICIYSHLYLQHIQAVSFTVLFIGEGWGNFKKHQLCYIFMMAGWALEENCSELTWSKETSIDFIVHTGNSNPEINMDTMDCTNLFKVHWVGSGGFVGGFFWGFFLGLFFG